MMLISCPNLGKKKKQTIKVVEIEFASYLLKKRKIPTLNSNHPDFNNMKSCTCVNNKDFINMNS